MQHTIRASESPSAIAASLKPPPEKGMALSQSKKLSTSLVQPLLCTRQPAKCKAQYNYNSLLANYAYL